MASTTPLMTFATHQSAVLVAEAMRHNTAHTQIVPMSRQRRAPIFVMNFAPIRLPTNAKIVASMGPNE